MESPRLESLDAFRGAVILTMVFVNYLAGVDGIPAWARHMPDRQDGFTVVDLVFPGFLFIVGVSLPLAIENRRRRGESLVRVMGHVLARAGGLLFLGVLLVNQGSFSASASGLSRDLWVLLALGSAVVVWCPPRGGAWSTRPVAWFAARVLALGVLAYAVAVFRAETGDGRVVWLRHSWWGILGLIGWAYVNAAWIYLVTRGSRTALMGVLGLLIALYIGGRHGRLDWLGSVGDFVEVGPVLGSTSANVLAGVLVGTLFVGRGLEWSPTSRAAWMVVFGAGLYAAGMLLRPLHGIVKNQATEAYTLVAAGLCCGVFAAFYWVVDVRARRGWAAPLLPAGRNPLLVYLLPDLLDAAVGIVGVPWLLWPCHAGWAGALNAAWLTAVVLTLNWGLTRAGLRLRL